MKIKFALKFLAIPLIAILLSSCGGTITEKKITASDISISGEGSDYFEVVDGDYTLKVVDDKVVIAIKLELIQEFDGDGKPEMGNLNLVPLDKDGAAVPDLGLDFRPATMSDYDKIKDLLRGEIGKTVTVSFEWSYFSKKDIQKRIMEQTESFEITRADFTGGKSSYSSSDSNSSSDDDDSFFGSGSEDWDAVLKSYESYIDQYIKLMKKAKNGDASAMTEYAEMMEKATDLAEKMESAGDDLSTAQMNKFMKLQTKLANAAMEMY